MALLSGPHKHVAAMARLACDARVNFIPNLGRSGNYKPSVHNSSESKTSTRINILIKKLISGRPNVINVGISS